MDELHLEITHPVSLAGLDGDELGLVQQPVLGQLGRCQTQRVPGAVDGNMAQGGEHEGQRPDVILVAVGQHDGLNLGGVVNQEGDVGDNDVDAQEFFIREHQAGIHHDHLGSVAEHHHVHPELPEAA